MLKLAHLSDFKRTLLSLCGGVFITLSLAPINLWLLAFIAPACFYLSLKDLSAKKASLQGWVFGLGLYGSGASWVFVSIYHHSDTPFWLALLMTSIFVAAIALFFALQGWIVGRFLNRGKYYSAAFIGLWVLSEWLRSWFLTGFPWLYSGYALLETPLNTWAPIGGVWLLSFCVALTSVALLNIVLTPQRSKIIWATCITLFALPAMVLPKEWTNTIDTQEVDIVQANIPQHLKWNKNYLPEILTSYTHTTTTQTTAPLIIWPETAVSTYLYGAMPYLVNTLEQLEAEGRTLVSGYPAIVSDNEHPDGHRVHNSLSVITADGQGQYHKQRLVPFGEYVPLEAYLRGIISFFNLPMSGFSLPVEEQKPLPVRNGLVAPAICYEIAYPELVRVLAKESNWILTLSNDTWFSHSLAPAQHLQIAQMRALENNRWVVRSTNNGLTALINAQGKVHTQAPAYTRSVLSGEIELRTGQTPYQIVGAWPVLILSILLCLVGLRRYS